MEGASLVKIEINLTAKNSLYATAGIAMLLEAVIPFIVSADDLKTTRWHWIVVVIAVVGGLALIVQVLLQSRDDYKRDEQFDQILKRAESGQAERADIAETKIDLPSAPLEAKSVDSEIYRVVTGAKHAVAGMVRELYQMQNRLDEFKMDADILIELYAVNTSGKRLFLRNFTGAVELDGKSHPMIRQNDFYAWDFSNSKYEYCLNMKEDGHTLDRSSLVTLTPAISSLPLELEDRKPIEGWVHFVVKDVDPETLSKNGNYKFTFVDSLGAEIPMTKASTTKRRGEVEVRMIPKPQAAS
jgi:hypothetical protein